MLVPRCSLCNFLRWHYFYWQSDTTDIEDMTDYSSFKYFRAHLLAMGSEYKITLPYVYQEVESLFGKEITQKFQMRAMAGRTIASRNLQLEIDQLHLSLTFNELTRHPLIVRPFGKTGVPIDFLLLNDLMGYPTKLSKLKRDSLDKLEQNLRQQKNISKLISQSSLNYVGIKSLGSLLTVDTFSSNNPNHMINLFICEKGIVYQNKKRTIPFIWEDIKEVNGITVRGKAGILLKLRYLQRESHSAIFYIPDNSIAACTLSAILTRLSAVVLTDDSDKNVSMEPTSDIYFR